MTAEKREKAGKGAARALRRSGKTPAIIYGRGQKEMQVSFETKHIEAQIKRAGFMSSLFDINVDGTSYRALPKLLQLHPVSDVVEHIDFIHVDKDALIKVKVRIQVINQDKCIGIKRGGILNTVNREIEIECRPDDIPSYFEVDITKLHIGQNIHLKDISLPEKVAATASGDLTILTIAGRTSEDEETTSTESAEGTAQSAETKKEN